MSDEEDVALSVFNSLCEGVANDGFPRLTNRDELWQTLVLLTCRKAVSQWRRERAVKRGGRQVTHRDEITLERLLDRQPDPALAALFADQVRNMLQQLPSEELRQIAELRLQGCSQQEIVVRIGSSGRTVRRRLALIREIWEQFAEGVS
jgi:DNA-directed RNA polymerase specialized sigma24 family protein